MVLHTSVELSRLLCGMADRLLQEAGPDVWRHLHPRSDGSIPFTCGIAFDSHDHTWRTVFTLTNSEGLDRLERTAKIHGMSVELWTLMVFLEGQVENRPLGATMQKAMFCDDSDAMYLGTNATTRQPGFSIEIVASIVTQKVPRCDEKPDLDATMIRVAEAIRSSASRDAKLAQFLDDLVIC